MKKNYFVFLFVFAAGICFAQSPRFYIGGRAGLGPVMGNDGTSVGGNLNPLQFDWQINKYLVLETGLGFYFSPQMKHTALKQTDTASGLMETYAGMETHIVFPLLLKAGFRPGIFSIELGGGLYAAPVAMNTTVERTNNNGFTVSEAYGKKLFSARRNNPFGFAASASLGVKAGRGIIFFDLSWLREFSELSVYFNDHFLGSHLWNIFAFNIGFKYGFFSK